MPLPAYSSPGRFQLSSIERCDSESFSKPEGSLVIVSAEDSWAPTPGMLEKITHENGAVPGEKSAMEGGPFQGGKT